MARGAGYYSGDDSEKQTKIAQAMNLLMSGSAFLYYGEELGMKGSGKDEISVHRCIGAKIAQTMECARDLLIWMP